MTKNYGGIIGGTIIEKRSLRRNPWKKNHREEIIEKESRGRNDGRAIIEEAWRSRSMTRNQGGEIIGRAMVHKKSLRRHHREVTVEKLLCKPIRKMKNHGKKALEEESQRRNH